MNELKLKISGEQFEELKRTNEIKLDATKNLKSKIQFGTTYDGANWFKPHKKVTFIKGFNEKFEAEISTITKGVRKVDQFYQTYFRIVVKNLTAVI